MSHAVMVDDLEGERLTLEYLTAVCLPLLDLDQQATFLVEVGRPFEGEVVFRVLVGRNGGSFLVGSGGKTADAIRLLVRAEARAIGWDARVDVRVSRRD